MKKHSWFSTLDCTKMEKHSRYWSECFSLQIPEVKFSWSLSNEVLKSIANEECNCRKKNGFRQCAYQGKCNKSGVYKISLVDANESLKQVYIGSTGRFKERFSKHDTRAASADSIVAKNMKLNMEWKCVKEILYVMYIGGKACTICNSEKFEIFEYRPPDPTVMFLNKRSEIFGNCMHKSIVERIKQMKLWFTGYSRL